MTAATHTSRRGRPPRNTFAHGSRALLALTLLALTLLAACGDEPASTSEQTGQTAASTTPETTPDASPDPSRCAAPPGVSGSPRTIAQAVTLINALPRPVTVACVVEALDDPLRLNATDSQVSAQPADGVANPRIFIMNEGLVLSVTLGETGRHLLEFGELRGDGLSVKGELIFPIVGEVAPSDPFAHLPYNEDVTTCGLCHRDEVSAGFIDGVEAFASRPLRPIDASVVPLDDVAALRGACDPSEGAERCDLLDALFGREGVVEARFTEETRTIFE